MTEENGFLAMLRDNPNDDVTKLVYADWLAEHGHDRTAALLREQAGRKLAVSAGRVDEIGGELVWQLTAAEFMSPELRHDIRSNGRILTMHIIDIGDKMEELAQCPHLAFLDRLSLCSNDISAKDAATLVKSRYLSRITNLDLSDNSLGDDGVETIFKSDRLPSLKSLNLGACAANFTKPSMLPDETHFELRELDLSHNAIRNQGMQALVRSPSLAGLESLNLGHNSLSLTGIKTLASAAYLRPAKLNIARNDIGSQGAAQLAHSEVLDLVTDLDLSRNNIYDRGVRAIALSSRTEHLRCLKLEDNHLTPLSTEILANNLSLEHLHVGGNTNIPKKEIAGLNEIAKAGKRDFVIHGKWDKGRLPGEESKRGAAGKWSRLIKESEPQDRGLTTGIS